MVFASYARKYFESNYSVIPTKHKRPIFYEWSKYCEIMPTDQEFDDWEAKHLDSNIGLCLGPASGIVAFDFDWNGPHAEIVENWVLGHLPIMPVKKVGEKGWTGFFKYSGQTNRKLQLFVNNSSITVFDFLSSGKQTIVPPSIHPKGYTYRWITEDTLLNFEAKDLPEITDKEIDDLCSFIQDNFPRIHELADAKVASIEPRHNQIFKQICKLSTKLKTVEEIVNAIYEFDKHRQAIQAPGWAGRETAYFYDPKHQPRNALGIKAATVFVKRVTKWQEKSQAKLGQTFVLGENPKPMAADADYAIYDAYKTVFQELYPNINKCKLSGFITSVTKEGLRYPGNEEKFVKSECMLRGLKKNDTPEMFARWLREIPATYNYFLPEWDGVDHIGNILSYVCVEDCAHDAFVDLFKDWMAGIFKRIEDKDYQNKMVILRGDQGIGKDTFIKALFDGFGPYFINAEVSNNEKDTYEKMARALVINISEFDRAAKISSAQIKNMITADSVTYRKPYDRYAENVNFHCSFISSCNIDNVFKDDTGNRRYLFFKVSSIKWGYNLKNSAQILAQAKALCAQNFKAATESVGVMNEVINEMTPDRFDKIVVEQYNLRCTRLGHNLGKSELTFEELLPVFNDIRRELDIKSLRTVLSIVKQAGYRKKTKLTRSYTYSVITEELLRPANILSFGKTIKKD
jgi:hypothetical protein